MKFVRYSRRYGSGGPVGVIEATREELGEFFSKEVTDLLPPGRREYTYGVSKVHFDPDDPGCPIYQAGLWKPGLARFRDSYHKFDLFCNNVLAPVPTESELVPV